MSTDSNPELEAESQPKHEPDSEPKGADRPWLVYQVPIQEAFVGAYREFGTFELVDGCAVFNNEHDQTSYLVAVFEGGGRPFDEGRAIQLPRYRVTFGSGIRYRVAGWPNGVPDAEFLDDMPPNCPTETFLVLEVGLLDGELAPGKMVALVLGCNNEPFLMDCGLRVSHGGRVWAEQVPAEELSPIEQRSSQVEGLPEGSSLWSTTRTDRILLLDPATNDYIVLSREISRAGDRSPSGTRGG
ncbi:MAG: hypothetical protein GY724_25295 [Actinomycetia bacterium]|nr:hypothetical protein [Actinomycetes bacterium]